MVIDRLDNWQGMNSTVFFIFSDLQYQLHWFFPYQTLTLYFISMKLHFEK